MNTILGFVLLMYIVQLVVFIVLTHESYQSERYRDINSKKAIICCFIPAPILILWFFWNSIKSIIKFYKEAE